MRLSPGCSRRFSLRLFFLLIALFLPLIFAPLPPFLGGFRLNLVSHRDGGVSSSIHEAEFVADSSGDLGDFSWHSGASQRPEKHIQGAASGCARPERGRWSPLQTYELVHLKFFIQRNPLHQTSGQTTTPSFQADYSSSKASTGRENPLN